MMTAMTPATDAPITPPLFVGGSGGDEGAAVAVLFGARVLDAVERLLDVVEKLED